MSCFKFPTDLCEEITSMANRFWWRQHRGERKVHWLNKKHLDQSKKEGGIGFCDLQLFNKALLARHGWRLLQNPHSLVFRILKSKCFPSNNFLEASMPSNHLSGGVFVIYSKDMLNEGLRWRVGTDEMINIWKDPWLPCPSTHLVITPILEIHVDILQWII
jgi:hypothetical protein